ncbi:hypothetical protein [Alkalihalobacillus pseudalcaliphilus]|uniref:hypothetical protein n=1 Tax=Alkalihalobacillus pseudalcaliphilus TaxID=79884 RepID=UPI000AAC4333|nr:hypothetical protein [Alkalihalobacillus pseudalcaliphilus]
MKFQFNPELTLLLSNQPGLVTMTYLNHSWKMQKIGPRPPFYRNPSYQSNFPLI